MSVLKTSFAVSQKHEAFYTGGKIQRSKNGELLFCGCGNKVNVLDVTTGKVTETLEQEEDEEITCYCITPDDKYLIVATRHLVLRQWLWREKSITRTWKAIHTSAVTAMTFDKTSTLLATGSSDSSIKLWDIERQYCTHNLRGHQGVVSVVEFHPIQEKLQLFSAANDNKVRVWDLMKSSCIAEIEAHFSVVTSLCFSVDGKTLYSGGRDNILAVWDVEKLQVTKTIPILENVESVVLLPENSEYPNLNVTEDGHHIITFGSKGSMKIWNVKKSKCVFSKFMGLGLKSETESGSQTITQAWFAESEQNLTVVVADHTISMYNIENIEIEKQFCGYTDEILDLQFIGKDDSHLVVCTNSENLKVYNVKTWSCQILHGHTDIVLSVAVHKDTNMIATASKDNSIRMWNLDPETGMVHCCGEGQGHTSSVGSINFSSLSGKFVVSGGEDCTIKMWDVGADSYNLHCRATERAHDKDINSIAVSPNDKYIVTASQDKTAKLWVSKDLSMIGVLRGHRKGIWCVQFSPVDQCAVTSSADGTIKIWSLSDFTCVKTFEGHDSSVLRVVFLTRGMQLLSCGSDGLLKLWTIKTNECVKTFDEHDDKVWGLAISSDENSVITGGADSTILEWQDITQEVEDTTRKEQEQFIIREQELSNLIQQKKYHKAIALAIKLEQPFRVLTILKEILASQSGVEDLQATLQKLRQDQLDSVLRFCGQWNTNSKNCHEAQFILSIVLKSYTAEDLLKFPNMKSTIESLLPYTERHFNRLTRLQQQAMFVEYTWQCMKGITDINSNDKQEIETEDRVGQYVIDKNPNTVDDDDEDENMEMSDDNEDKMKHSNMVSKMEENSKLSLKRRKIRKKIDSRKRIKQAVNKKKRK